MREHRLTPLAASVSSATGSCIGQGSGGSTPARQRALSLPAQQPERAPVQYCSVHPEEPAQFFCLDCESECICAECAVQRDGAHHGHDVINVRTAYQRLSGEIASLLEASRMRANENARTIQQAKVMRRDLDSVIDRGKRSIQEAFEHMQASLRVKEAELLTGCDDCRAAADRALARRAEEAERRASEVWEVHAMLDGVDTHGDEVKVLNSYAVTRAAAVRILDLPAGSPDSGGLVQELEDLKDQVHRTLEAQAVGVASLSARVPELRRAGAEAPPSPNLPELG